MRQTVTLNVGISTDKAKEIGKFVKELGLKGVSHQIQGDQLRISGKKRDDLQAAIAAHEGPRLRGARCSSPTSATDCPSSLARVRSLHLASTRSESRATGARRTRSAYGDALSAQAQWEWGDSICWG